MSGDFVVDEFSAKTFKRREGARLVSAHQSAIADHVGGKNSSEAAFHVVSTNLQQSMEYHSLIGKSCRHYVIQLLFLQRTAAWERKGCGYARFPVGKKQRAGDPPTRKTTAWQADGRERGGKVISDK